ncbi:MAG TPA: hypothetical protein VJQ25_12570 [Nitrospira sp.]|nr:hypothetical protein [Nitrospira sp.]
MTPATSAERGAPFNRIVDEPATRISGVAGALPPIYETLEKHEKDSFPFV